MSTTHTRALLWLGLLSTAIFVFGIYTENYWLRMAVKPLPMLCLMDWIWSYRQRAYGQLILLGFVLSLAGDMLLEASTSLFLPGLVSFLLAHLCYIRAYVGRSRTLRLGLALPFFGWGAGVYVFLLPYLGPMAVPVGVYVAVICAMMWRAAACVDNGNLRRLALYGVLGASIFALSDSMIAFNKFYAPFALARYGIILLYWLGQFGIAASARES
jgi:alkenylglycerophosphocholine/alkenylglycerophosphoethanolamine hydrolase